MLVHKEDRTPACSIWRRHDDMRANSNTAELVPPTAPSVDVDCPPAGTLGTDVCSAAEFVIQCPATQAPPAVLPDILHLVVAFVESRVRGADTNGFWQARGPAPKRAITPCRQNFGPYTMQRATGSRLASTRCHLV